MHRNSVFKVFLFFVIVMYAAFCGPAFCQNTFDKSLTKKTDSLLAPAKAKLVPNDAIQSLTIPSGWGGYGFSIFGGVGGVYKQVYSNKPDIGASAGISVGNPEKAVNFAASANLDDVHRAQDFSYNFTLSRVIFTGTSISAGALQVFAKVGQTDVPNNGSYYLALTHAVQSLPSKTPGASRLTYTIGIGTGRFYLKSPLDNSTGRGYYGSAVFGAISYEIIHHVNINAEWDGLNLAGTIGITPFRHGPSIGIGAENLLRTSSDKPNAVFTIGYPLSLIR